MIDFDCLCRQYRFSVPDELAGDTIQCPTCRRLNDIPTESNLQEMDEFGGYKIELVDDPKALDRDLAIKSYTRGRIDDDGHQIDMRQTFDEVMRAGAPASPIAFDGLKKSAPKYDPFTGEVIRPLAIKDEKPLAVIPLDAMPDEKPLDAIPITPKTIEYGRARVGSTTVAMASGFLVLLKPENLIVMIFVLVAHLIVFATGLIVMMGFIFVVVAPLVMLMSLFAHYGNVIDEIGPTDRDEIPVPLRNGSIYEDIWLPFVQVIESLALAFSPLIFLHYTHLPAAVQSAASIVALFAGCAAAPVILLTIVTSGAYDNLRPDRMVSVVRICGFQYLIASGTFAAAGGRLHLVFGHDQCRRGLVDQNDRHRHGHDRPRQRNNASRTGDLSDACGDVADRIAVSRASAGVPLGAATTHLHESG